MMKDEALDLVSEENHGVKTRKILNKRRKDKASKAFMTAFKIKEKKIKKLD